MNLRQIEIFHAVYINGSVSAAARALGVSQPAVSKTLRHAEDTIGFRLFDRRHGRLIPTADARAMFGEVSEIQTKVAALKQTSRNIRLGNGGALRISALPSLGLGVLPEAVARYLARHPSVTFDLDTVHHADVARTLFNQSSDVVIAFEPPAGFPVATRWLGEGELGVLSRRDDLLPPGTQASERTTLSALSGQHIISIAQSGPIGEMIAREMARLEIEVEETIAARTFYIAAALVRGGVGSALIDNFTAQAMAGPGLVFSPLRPALPIDVYAIWLENRPPSVRMEEFLEIISSMVDQV
jgi:DNA-binding transcriptional LysR family regulator